MFQWLTQRIQAGLHRVRSHQQLLLVGVFVLVLPLCLVVVTARVVDTAAENVASIEKQQVATWHDAAAAIARDTDALQTLIDQAIEHDETLTAVAIYREQGAEQDVIAGTTVTPELPAPDLVNIARGRPGETVIIPFRIGTTRAWHALRYIPQMDAKAFTIHTEHRFTQRDQLLAARTHEIYVLIGAALAALILLAFWVHRQIDFAARLAQAQQEMHERDLLANTIVHELRAPLTAVRGFASLIEESPQVANEERGFATQIKAAATRLVRVVNDFLEIARLQSGREQLVHGSVDAAATVTAVVHELAPTAAKKGLTLTHKLPEHSISFTCDGDRLQRILTNVVNNAIKYTESGSVTIVLSANDRSVIFRVEDTGRGISAEDQQKLFQPFSRVGDQTQQQNVTGTGLGMWITKKLVEQLGGTIGVESIKSVGTHVVVSFPRIQT